MSERSGFRRWRADDRSADAIAALCNEYGLTARLESATFTYEGAGDDDLSIRSVVLGGLISGALSARRDHIVAWTNNGSAMITGAHGEPTELVPGQPVVLSAASSYTFSVDAEKITMVHLSDELVHEVATELELTLDDPLLFDIQDPVLAEIAPFGSVVHSYGGIVVDPNATPADRRDAARKITAAVLDVFPLIDPDGLSNHRLRDAISYIHAHAREDVDVDSIANAVGMSVRGLQDLFARAIGTTPVSYLRDVRLAGVRDELRLQTPEQAAVGTVARRWGFRHLGRFAAAYRARFGVLPTETLRTGAETPDGDSIDTPVVDRSVSDDSGEIAIVP